MDLEIYRITDYFACTTDKEKADSDYVNDPYYYSFHLDLNEELIEQYNKKYNYTFDSDYFWGTLVVWMTEHFGQPKKRWKVDWKEARFHNEEDAMAFKLMMSNQ